MRRADRLFQIIQILRGARRPLTARELADELERDPRTIYRDMADLVASGVPVRGEAGVGYVLEAGYDLPPLMLTADELEAALLGAQWVMERGDPALVRGARDLLAKLDAVLPGDMRHLTDSSGLLAAGCVRDMVPDTIDMQALRRAIPERRKLAIVYGDEQGRTSERIVWPIHIGYFERVRLIVGWCELRGAFRNFRSDRIIEGNLLSERFAPSLRQLRRAWREQESCPIIPAPR
ncbi:YafY family transcriptional regulator [Sphingobium phenoxybenzoativorans]|jgi:predicted DNA-binding transcriptional regulator YafY|uniref:YafY family transcriptional regulator n=1 Tax=Sphingobium phenoxybenzoativorans TaxID=1592790 RepID=A0A975Q3C5_9SPHN|nr:MULTISPECIES: YafY family protein [Sphingobium]QUT07601.1 YafY family transcriptional regulator [Sphingobium phenoxybenzoativorans]